MKIDVIPNPETVKFISTNLRELTLAVNPWFGVKGCQQLTFFNR